MKEMPAGFTLLVASLPDHEMVVGEIYYDDMLLAVVDQGNGSGLPRIELFTKPDGSSWKLTLRDLHEAMEITKRRLIGDE